MNWKPGPRKTIIGREPHPEGGNFITLQGEASAIKARVLNRTVQDSLNRLREWSYDNHGAISREAWLQVLELAYGAPEDARSTVLSEIESRFPLEVRPPLFDGAMPGHLWDTFQYKGLRPSERDPLRQPDNIVCTVIRDGTGLAQSLMPMYLITQRDWVGVMKQNPSRFRGEAPPNKKDKLILNGSVFEGDPAYADHPVETVTWFECLQWCNLQSEREGRRPMYLFEKDGEEILKVTELEESDLLDGELPGYTLPTEVEWEMASRAGTVTTTYAGDCATHNALCPILDEIAWYFHNSNGATHTVGEKAPNAFGIYDSLGNVWKWMSDMRGFD